VKVCKACGKDYRLGALVMLLDDGANAGGRHTRVCRGCARGGITLVAARTAKKASRTEACDLQQAAQNLQKTLESVIRQLRNYAKAARAAGMSFETGPGVTHPEETFHQGRAEAFEGAITLLQNAFREIKETAS